MDLKDEELEDFALRVMMPTRLLLDIGSNNTKYSQILSMLTGEEMTPTLYAQTLSKFAYDENRDVAGFKDFLWKYRNFHLRNEYVEDSYTPIEPFEKEHLTYTTLDYVLNRIREERELYYSENK